MYQVYREDEFPEGIFRTEKGRREFAINAFRDVYRDRHGMEPTDEIRKNECRLVENAFTSTYELLPCLGVYYRSLPYVRLYFRGGKYELHLLDAEASREEALGNLAQQKAGM